MSLLNEKPKKIYPSYFLPAIDDCMDGGFRSGTMNIVTADSGLGKSTYACQLALHQAFNGHKVLFICTEMMNTDVLPRLYAVLHGKNIRDYELKVNVDNTQNIKDAEELFEPIKQNLTILYERDFDQISAYLFANADRFEMVIIDHVHCRTFSANSFTTDLQADKYIINMLTNYWLINNLCFVLVAQPRKPNTGLNVAFEKENIRGTAEWYYQASQIIYLFETEKQKAYNQGLKTLGDPDQISLYLAKRRFRGLNTFPLHVIYSESWKGKFTYAGSMKPNER
jgi:hypothetical protein